MFLTACGGTNDNSSNDAINEKDGNSADMLQNKMKLVQKEMNKTMMG